MRRGKRQIVQPSSSIQVEQQKTHQSQSNYFQNIINNKFNNTSHLISGNQNIIENKIRQQPTKEQVPQKLQQMDEKKRKILLLKQKYLKKNKPQQNYKNQSVICDRNDTLLNANNNLVKQAENKPPVQAYLQKTQLTTPNQTLKLDNKTPIQPQPVQPVVVTPNLNKNNQKLQKNQNLSNNIIQQPQCNSQAVILQRYDQVPKPPNKISSRNPPPPPSIKKTQTPPPPIKKQSNILQNNPNTETDYHTLQNSLNAHQNIQSISIKQQGPEFIKNQQKKSLSNGIPPPPNRNMKEMLTKKLSGRRQVPKPYNQNQNIAGQHELNGQQQQDIKLTQSAIKRNEQEMLNGHSKTNGKKYNLIDQQYTHIDNNIKQARQTIINSNGIQRPRNSNKQIIKDNVDPIKYIGQWLGSPQITLNQLFPSLKQTIQFYCLNKHINLQISSTNSNFNSLTSQFIHSFIINNAVKLTQDQKCVTEAVGLNFFYSNAAQMSDIFLILLVKMGKQYLQKYHTALQDRIQKYLERLILMKNLLLNQQIDIFVNFSIEKGMTNQKNYLLFLMLSCQNTQLISLISNNDFKDLKYSLSVLSLCKINLKARPNLIGLHLKLISNLAPQFTQAGLVQKILNHLKQIDITQSHYQYSKQLKLKLLKNYDQNLSQDKNQKVQQNKQSSQNKDKGLFGYFNLNKAIDKIKTSTQKALGAVEKQTKPQQEQKKDQIVYDPIKKRYVINGQIPQDQDARNRDEGQQSKQRPLPPPPTGIKKAPPPPPIHGKKPGPRVNVNRYV